MTWTKLSLPRRLLAFTTSLAFVGFTNSPMIPVEARDSLRSPKMPVDQLTFKLGAKSQAFSRLQASLKFTLPPLPYRRTPGRRRGAASRGECPSVSKPLTALVPVAEQKVADTRLDKAQVIAPIGLNWEFVWGKTVAERPTFWFYVPYTLTAKLPVEFVLQDEAQKPVYEATFTAIGTSPGIISFQLPSPAAPLEVNKMYHWYFVVNCDPDDPIFVEGWIQRSLLNSELKRQLEQATPREQVSLYAANGIWYEAMTSLAELRHANPKDTSLTTDWTGLLQSVGLGAIAQEPIVRCCTAEK